MQTEEALLRIEGLTIALPADGDREHAVRDIDLTLHAGEILCVVGESGSGKSMCANASVSGLPARWRSIRSCWSRTRRCPRWTFRSRRRVLRLLHDLQQRLWIALVFITHDLRVAAKVCDTVLVMHRGRIVERGSPRQIFEQPRDEYPRRLIAAVPGQHWNATQGGGMTLAAVV